MARAGLGAVGTLSLTMTKFSSSVSPRLRELSACSSSEADETSRRGIRPSRRLSRESGKEKVRCGVLARDCVDIALRGL